MHLHLDAAILVCLAKNQRAGPAPHRADTVLSSSAAGVSEDKEIGPDQAWGGSWQTLHPCPLHAIRWTQALEKNHVIKILWLY